MERRIAGFDGIRGIAAASIVSAGVSYGVYVWQSFYVTTGPIKVGHWPLDFPYNVLLLVLIVPVLWRFVERPFLRLQERFRPGEPAPEARTMRRPSTTQSSN